MDRRRFLADAVFTGFALTPIAAMLAACGRASMPEGMAEVKWDRDTCVRCSMVLSDRRFAAQVRGGPKDAGASKAYYEKAAALGNEDAKAALKRADCPIAIRDKRGKQVGCF